LSGNIISKSFSTCTKSESKGNQHVRANISSSLVDRELFYESNGAELAPILSAVLILIKKAGQSKFWGTAGFIAAHLNLPVVQFMFWW